MQRWRAARPGASISTALPVRWAVAVALVAMGCTATAPGGEATTTVSAASLPALPRPTGPLDRDDAERYVLALVNRDRAEHGLGPVVWDEAAARAGRGHAEDMAAHGFTAHLGTDGSVPEHRYTVAGGEDMVMENVGCFADGVARPLDPEPRFLAEELEKIEHAFMDEVPPMDGHRRNILTPWHTSMGVGLAQTRGLAIPCMAQELVDDHGSYDELPRRARVGERVKVGGKVAASARIAGVGVARVDPRQPLTPAALNQTNTYAIPQPYATYFPRGFKTPIPLEVEGDQFHIAVPLDDRKRAGLYGVSVWGKLPDSDDLRMISLRTIIVH